MHSFLRAIGFSEYDTKEKLLMLLNDANEKPDRRSALMSESPEIFTELIKFYGKEIGIHWQGTICEGEPEYDYYFPIYHGKHVYIREGFSVEKRISNNTYIGIVEEPRAGVSLIFSITNNIDYVEMDKNDEIDYSRVPIALSGLSIGGTILLPVSMSERDIRKKNEQQKERIKLLKAAKQGDERAMESLTFQDMDAYNNISKRIVSEDIFTIVTSSFMPYGLECDRYAVIGDILEVEFTTNSVTGEKIWLMTLDINGIIIDIAINDIDLTGEPMAGRRFKGNIWLQARIYKKNV